MMKYKNKLDVYSAHIVAQYLKSKEDCEHELSTFDEPEKFQVIKVNITYEF